MSRVRPGTCADPGPDDLHCTEPRGHRYSCYDAGEDESWNDGTMADDPRTHLCDDPACAPSQPAATSGSVTGTEQSAPSEREG